METLDSPATLKYNNGNNFPTNFKMISYMMLVGSIALIVTGWFVFGGILLLISTGIITNRNIVIIDSVENFIHDYSLFLGFIKIGKKYPLDKYKYVTTMPLIESRTVYASTSNSSTISHSYITVTLFGERLKGKRVITKFESKNEAMEVASKLSDRLGLKFFEYDPKLVRQILLGQKTI
ncbi:MAG: hypothetical protein ACJASQ_001008 [Crocinitomicaceae bacterium]|jgi:hypothetical protein